MVAHRKTPSRKAYSLPGWFFVLSAIVAVIAAAALGWLVYDTYDDSSSAATPTATATTSAPAPTASPTPSGTPSSSATPSPTPTEPSPTASPTPDRSSIAVSVLNGSRTVGLARTTATRVEQRGWTVGAVGNWTSGAIARTSVFYPDGHEQQARQLASDLGINSVLPRMNTMSTERLTLVLLGPLG